MKLKAGDEARGLGVRHLDDLLELVHFLVLDRGVLADQAADAELCDELETPSSEVEVVSVAAVREVEVEDRLNGLGAFSDDPVVGDVDSVVGVGGEDIDSPLSKGSITA